MVKKKETNGSSSYFESEDFPGNTFPFDFELEEYSGFSDKNKSTTSENFHRHHYKLSKKINEICERINKFEYFLKRESLTTEFLLSLFQEEFIKDAIKKFADFKEQQYKIENEKEILEQKRAKLRKIIEVPD